MAHKNIDKELRRRISDARRLVDKLMKADGNEAETRRRVERIFERVMGYDAFVHLSRERAIRGAGETEHVDFAVQLEPGPDAEPIIMVELKRVGVDLALKHLKQVASYAIDSGCEWILLTNSRDWRLYHVQFGQPPKTQLIEHWNLLTNDIVELATKFDVISYKNVKKGSLNKLWEKATVLSPDSLLGALVSIDSMRVIRRILRKNTGVMVAPEDVMNGIQRLLNENAAIELSKIKTLLPKEKSRIPKTGKAKERMPKRYAIRQQFWTKLLDCAKSKTTLHSTVSPGEWNYIGTGAGVSGLGLNYIVTKHAAAIELYIDRGKDSEKDNKMIFGQLLRNRNEIEELFGEPLDWQQLEGKRACRIRNQITLGGYQDEEKWPTIHEAMVDAMVSFEKALRPYIEKLQV